MQGDICIRGYLNRLRIPFEQKFKHIFYLEELQIIQGGDQQVGIQAF
jgi:hypothetical protein